MILHTLLTENPRSQYLVGILAVMANRKRLLILALICEKAMPVGEIAYAVNLSAAATSQHLARLRAKKLVQTRRLSQTVYYSAASNASQEILLLLERLLVSFH